MPIPEEENKLGDFMGEENIGEEETVETVLGEEFKEKFDQVESDKDGADKKESDAKTGDTPEKEAGSSSSFSSKEVAGGAALMTAGIVLCMAAGPLGIPFIVAGAAIAIHGLGVNKDSVSKLADKAQEKLGSSKEGDKDGEELDDDEKEIDKNGKEVDEDEIELDDDEKEVDDEEIELDDEGRESDTDDIREEKGGVSGRLNRLAEGLRDVVEGIQKGVSSAIETVGNMLKSPGDKAADKKADEVSAKGVNEAKEGELTTNSFSQGKGEEQEQGR